MPAPTAIVPGIRTFQATAVAISAHRRVKVDSSGLISLAASTESGPGTTIEDVAASGYGAVQLYNGDSTILLTASAAITRGSALWAANNGKVAGSGTINLGLVSLQTAAADGDIIEAIVVR